MTKQNPTYQSGPRWHGVRLNISLLCLYLDPGTRTAIDIGSNEGFLTCTLAELGVDATGFEQNRHYHDNARLLRRHYGARAKFENRLVSAADLDTMEPIDAALFLSVHHQIAAATSLDAANDMLMKLCRKARKQVFFQPAMISAKYGCKMPFADNDFHAIEAYFGNLAAEAGMPYSRNVGISINDLPKSEPLRPMLVYGRSPIELRENGRPAELLAKAAAGASFLTSSSSQEKAIKQFVPPLLWDVARRLKRRSSR
ncbi:MAG: hypothetical protein WD942_12365 [Dehalococcoidia bacterium]